MKSWYITAILAVAIIIMVSGCGKQEAQEQPSVPSGDGQAPAAPTDEGAAAGGEAPVEPAPPSEGVTIDVSGAGSAVTETAVEGKFLTGVGCTNAGVVSFTLKNAGNVPLVLDKGQELTGSELEGKELLKVTFNGKPLRMLNCGDKIEFAPGDSVSCTQSEGVTIRTVNPYGAPVYNVLQVRTETGNQRVQLGTCS